MGAKRYSSSQGVSTVVAMVSLNYERQPVSLTLCQVWASLSHVKSACD